MNNKVKISSILNQSNNLVDIFNYHVQNKPLKKLFYKKEKGCWLSQNYKETYKNVKKIQNFLLSRKVKKGDRIFLLSNNRIEWAEFDLAIMSIGAITVPSFVTNNLSDNNFIIKNCNPKIIILETDKLYTKNKFSFKNDNVVAIEKSSKFICYEKIQEKFNENTKKIKIFPNDISSIIYTSGTTGNPKGVILTHKSIMHNLLGALDLFDDYLLKNERFFSFLPLSHSYERMAGLYFPILISAEIFFCSSLDKLLAEIKESKPTILSAVPRLYEGIFKKINLQVKTSGKLISFFLKKSLSLTNSQKKITMINYLIAKLFNFLILRKKIKKIFGGNVKVLISGGAALNPDVGNFFVKLGLDLLQGYGQTEASPLISCNRRNTNNPRTVGHPVNGVEVKISKLGEILVKGKNLMMGYWKNKNLTKQTIINGWLHTGDIGFLDNLNRIIITGRKKDIIVSSGGENISPQKIENLLSTFHEIEHAIVYGDNMPYLILLVKLSEGYCDNNLKRIIEITNKKLNSVEKIRKYFVIKKTLSYENGFMTQTMKLRKNIIFNFYKKEIDKLY